MAEATWSDEAGSQGINWRMSASLANVPRGGNDLAEVTNLAQAVHDWLALDSEHQEGASLMTEHAISVDGVTGTSFSGRAIAALAAKLPGAGTSE